MTPPKTAATGRAQVSDNNTIVMAGAIGMPKAATAGMTFSFRDVADEIAQMKDRRSVSILLNSPGGRVDDAIAIKDTLEKTFNKVEIRIAGLAASAATIIASARNAEVTAAPGSMYMIHNPWTVAMGDQVELRTTADVLEKRARGIARMYARRTGIPMQDIRSMMDEETWLDAQEALENGFIDSVDDEGEAVEAVAMGNGIFIFAGIEHDLSRFIRVPFINLQLPKENTMTEKPVQEPEQQEQTQIEEKPAAQAVAFASAEEMQAAYPEFCAAIAEQAKAEGIEQERARLFELDALATTQNAALIEKAKYETFATAEQCAIAILKAQKADAERRIEDIAADAQEATEVANAQQPALTNDEADLANLVNSVKTYFN